MNKVLENIIKEAFNQRSLAAAHIDLQDMYLNVDPINLPKRFRRNQRTAKNCKTFSERLRQNGIANIWVLNLSEKTSLIQHRLMDLDIVSKLPPTNRLHIVEPSAHEKLIAKYYCSAHSNGEKTLRNVLFNQHVRVLMMTGVESDVCVLDNAQDTVKFMDDIEIVVVPDCTNTDLTSEDYLALLRDDKCTRLKQSQKDRIHVADMGDVLECLHS